MRLARRATADSREGVTERTLKPALDFAAIREPDRTLIATFPSCELDEAELVLTFQGVSSLCPITGQPDTAEIVVTYEPDETALVEDSVWLYFCSFRNFPAFNEEVVNRILDDLVVASAPRRMRVKGVFAPRGGIRLTTEVSHPG